MTKKLPDLSLDRGCSDYIVSVDNSINRKAEKEIFIFAVVATCGEDALLVEQGIIINDAADLQGSSPFEGYCKQLADHYNTKVLFNAETINGMRSAVS